MATAAKATDVSTPRMALAEQFLARGEERAAASIAREILASPWTEAERDFAEHLVRQFAVPRHAAVVGIAVLFIFVAGVALLVLTV